MDLLTRGAGFGYIGSTITSLIYASFTFIFFALEAAVMAYALELALDIPPAWGYLVCALLVIPLVTHGVSIISRLQVWTQPLWLVMLVPFVYVAIKQPQVFSEVLHYGGERNAGAGFSLPLFGAALTVGIALITQMGEQADYLRFMPQPCPASAGAGGRGCCWAGRAGWCWAWPRCSAARCWPTWRFPTPCRPNMRWTRTRCTWPPTRTCFPITAGRWRPRRCSW
jgi:hypothetical protein